MQALIGEKNCGTFSDRDNDDDDTDPWSVVQNLDTGVSEFKI